VRTGVEQLDDVRTRKGLTADARSLREMESLTTSLPRIVERGDGCDPRVARRGQHVPAQAETFSSASRACTASARNAASSRTAMSARFLRSISMPASFSPCIRRL
jgi:hypothetical protein